MTTKTFPINGHEVLAVQVPQRSTITCIYNGNLIFTSNQHMRAITLPHGDWGVVCNKPCSEWSEAEAAELVERVDYDVPPSPGNDFQGDWRTGYRDYNSDEETGCSEYPFVRTAIKSLHSLLTSKELNPAETVLLRKK